MLEVGGHLELPVQNPTDQNHKIDPAQRLGDVRIKKEHRTEEKIEWKLIAEHARRL